MLMRWYLDPHARHESGREWLTGGETNLGGTSDHTLDEVPSRHQWWWRTGRSPRSACELASSWYYGWDKQGDKGRGKGEIRREEAGIRNEIPQSWLSHWAAEEKRIEEKGKEEEKGARREEEGQDRQDREATGGRELYTRTNCKASTPLLVLLKTSAISIASCSFDISPCIAPHTHLFNQSNVSF